MACNIVLSNMSQMDGAIEAANNGDLDPAENVFENMVNDFRSINVNKVYETAKEIIVTAIDKLDQIYVVISEE
ncbi:MAG: hypothetical protein DRN27_09285 [Thermoplasmata archaeon]|nr:MAG: hypothetical protein DRN27_09285 [Thermoplasmata archaeon]